MRYPLSGLIGNPADLKKTEEHNAQYPDYDENVRLLNRNVVAWLTSFIVVDGKKMPTNVRHKYETCLDAPNYTVFSNTTSAQQWNFDDGDPSVVPLESPHNDIHLSVGGFDVPGQATFPRSPTPTATWARTTRRAWTPSFTSTTASSTASSGSGSSGTGPPTRSR